LPNLLSAYGYFEYPLRSLAAEALRVFGKATERDPSLTFSFSSMRMLRRYISKMPSLH